MTTPSARSPSSTPPSHPTILHKHSYISPKHVARRIQDMRIVCNKESYLHCCVEYNEIKGLCATFASVLGDASLADPDAFHTAFASRDGEDSSGG